MGEPARHDDRIDAGHAGVAVPEELGVATEVADRLDGVLLAVRAGEEDDADPRGHQADAAIGDA